MSDEAREAVISELEYMHAEKCKLQAEIERLRAIETAAERVWRYFQTGLTVDVSVMAELRRALEQCK